MELTRRYPSFSRAIAGLVALLCLLATFASIGCGSTPSPEAPKQATPPPDAKPIIEASATRMSAITHAAFALDHDVGSSYLDSLGLYLDTVEGQIAMPDSYSMRMEATTTNRNAFVVVEFIGLGGKAYMNLLGRWGETDPLTLPFDFTSLGLRLADIMRAIQEPVIIDEQGTAEQVEGAPAWRIGGVVDSGAFKGLLVNASPGEPIKIDAWIGRGDSLLYRARVEGKLFSDDEADAVRVLTITAVDVPVDIEAPPL